jgi:hypothetical protein
MKYSKDEVQKLSSLLTSLILEALKIAFEFQ